MKSDVPEGVAVRCRLQTPFPLNSTKLENPQGTTVTTKPILMTRQLSQPTKRELPELGVRVQVPEIIVRGRRAGLHPLPVFPTPEHRQERLLAPENPRRVLQRSHQQRKPPISDHLVQLERRLASVEEEDTIRTGVAILAFPLAAFSLALCVVAVAAVVGNDGRQTHISTCTAFQILHAVSLFFAFRHGTDPLRDSNVQRCPWTRCPLMRVL